MLSLFSRNKALSTIEADEKCADYFMQYLDARSLVTVAPLITTKWHRYLSTQLQHKKEIAENRLRIYQTTLQHIPQFKQETPDSFSFSRLSGGFTNITFKLNMQNNGFFIARVPGKNSDKFIDRRSELYNAKIASRLGVNPDIVFGDGTRGAMLTKYIPSPVTMTKEILRADPQKIAAAAIAMRRVHQCGQPFANDLDVFKQNATLLSILREQKMELPPEQKPLYELMDEITQLFQTLTIEKAPCHNDTVYSNFLFGENKMHIIDWEYSGNNDAMWDLAYFSQLAELSKEQDQQLLTTYFDSADYQNTHPQAYQRFIVYKPLCNYFSFLWAHVQIAIKNNSVPQEEYEHLIKIDLASCLNRIEDATFKEMLANLKTHLSTPPTPCYF